MSIEQYRAKVKSGVWQAFAQSGVDLKSIPSEQQNKLADTITDNVLLSVNDILEQAPHPAGVTPVELEGDEQMIWEGRPFLSLVEFYTITSERVKVVKGLFGKDIENFELIRIQDIDVTQNLSERMLGIGDIKITGADATTPTVTLRDVRDPQDVYEKLRRAWLAARKKYGLIFREDM